MNPLTSGAGLIVALVAASMLQLVASEQNMVKEYLEIENMLKSAQTDGSVGDIFSKASAYLDDASASGAKKSSGLKGMLHMKSSKGKEVDLDALKQFTSIGPFVTGSSEPKCNAAEFLLLSANQAATQGRGKRADNGLVERRLIDKAVYEASIKHAEYCVQQYPKIFKAEIHPSRDNEVSAFHEFFMQKHDFLSTVHKRYNAETDGDVYEFMKSNWNDELKARIMDIPIPTNPIAMIKGVDLVKSKLGSKVGKLLNNKDSELSSYLLTPCRKFIDANTMFRALQDEVRLLSKAKKYPEQIGTDDRFDFYMELSKYRMCEIILDDEETYRERYSDQYERAMASREQIIW